MGSRGAGACWPRALLAVAAGGRRRRWPLFSVRRSSIENVGLRPVLRSSQAETGLRRCWPPRLRRCAAASTGGCGGDVCTETLRRRGEAAMRSGQGVCGGDRQVFSPCGIGPHISGAAGRSKRLGSPIQGGLPGRHVQRLCVSTRADRRRTLAGRRSPCERLPASARGRQGLPASTRGQGPIEHRPHRCQRPAPRARHCHPHQDCSNRESREPRGAKKRRFAPNREAPQSGDSHRIARRQKAAIRAELRGAQ